MYKLEPTGHTYPDEYDLKKSPTCYSEGTETVTCNKCPATKSRVIPATGKHSFGEWKNVSGTDASKGNMVRYCTECRFAEYKTNEKAALVGDVNNDGKITASDARLVLRASVGLEKLN